MVGQRKNAVLYLGSTQASETKQNDDDAIHIQVPSKEELSTCLGEDVVDSQLESITIHVSSPVSAHYDPLALASLISNLAQDGTVSVHIRQIDNNNNNPSSDDLKVVNTSFLLSSLHAESERKQNNKRVLVARLKAKSSSRSTNTAPIRRKKITLNLLDDEDDDDALINEDDLLDPTILAPPPAVDEQARKKAAADDCGGRKACDDCTCGRKELEEAGAAGAAPPINTSACGNCSKGDAFRCAGCPFLGKPAFKPGEEHLVLELTDDI